VLAQRAVADSPRWMRAVKGSLGRSPSFSCTVEGEGMLEAGRQVEVKVKVKVEREKCWRGAGGGEKKIRIRVRTKSALLS